MGVSDTCAEPSEELCCQVVAFVSFFSLTRDLLQSLTDICRPLFLPCIAKRRMPRVSKDSSTSFLPTKTGVWFYNPFI